MNKDTGTGTIPYSCDDTSILKKYNMGTTRIWPKLYINIIICIKYMHMNIYQMNDTWIRQFRNI